MKYIIYRISVNDYIYIGSTKDFKQRQIRHKSNCSNINDDHYNIKLYQIIRENGGWDKCEMVPIEEFECDGMIPSRIREEYWRREYSANMNSKQAHTTPEETTEKNHIRACINYNCECGGKYTHQNKTIHERTKKHLEYLELNKNITI
jgi:hypothetical protein